MSENMSKNIDEDRTATVRAIKPHIALNVHNIGRSIEFYQKMLGIEPSKVRTGYAKFDLQDPPLNLALNEVPFNERGALSHLGIQVASTADVLAVRERWAKAGLDPRDEMQTDCCYAIQDERRDPARYLSFNSAFRNGLTPSRPVRLSEMGPPSRPTSRLKAINGQQRRSTVIHSAAF